MSNQNWVTDGYDPISERCLCPNQGANKIICGSQQYRFYLPVNVRQRDRKKEKRGAGEREVGGEREREGRGQAEDSHHCGSRAALLVLLHSF